EFDFQRPRPGGRISMQQSPLGSARARLRARLAPILPHGNPFFKEPGKSKIWTLAYVLALATWSLAVRPARAQTFSCNPPKANQIVCENSKAGNPASDWTVSGAGDPTLQGFATDISVNQGQTIFFKIDTTASAYSIGIFRIGY